MARPILIADDHPLFREALTYIVKSVMTDCEIVEAIDYTETMSKLAAQEFKLAFLDLNMPDSNGLVDLAMIKKDYPQMPLIVVSANEHPETINSCMDHRASGYITKSASPNEIKTAIKSVLAGNTYTPPNIDLENSHETQVKTDNAQKINSLTPSQLRILIEIGKGKLNKQIAYDLGIKEATVKAHITSIFKKLGIYSRTQAVLLVKDHNLTE